MDLLPILLLAGLTAGLLWFAFSAQEKRTAVAAFTERLQTLSTQADDQTLHIQHLLANVQTLAREQFQTWTDTELERVRTQQADIASREAASMAQTLAQQQFQTWTATELERVRAQQYDLATREAQTSLDAWKTAAELAIRADAIQRSQSVIVGKVTEHLVPYLPTFAFNPKDARFVGSPIDLVVFDGLDEGDLREIVFVEVKTGAAASLTRRERQSRDALSAGRVAWRELRVPRSETLAQTLD